MSDVTLSSYADSITLTTQTGVGTFTSASTNNRSFSDAVANDGVATYTFHSLDAGVLLFAPSGFTFTSRVLPNPPPNPISDPVGNQTAGAEFNRHLTAYGTAPSDPECGVIESYTGDKPVRFWIGYGDPTTAPFVPTIDGNPIAASEAGAASQTLRFSQGRAVVTARYGDVGRITIQALDSSGTTSVRGASGSFVSRPANLAVVSVTNAQGDPNPGLSTPTGVPFARAGEPFQVRVEARGADGQRTPSYGRESVAERIRLQSSMLVAPIGGRNGPLNEGAIANADIFAAIAPDGTFTGSTFAYDEVGAIRLRASVADGDYLGAGPVVGTESGTVSRFAPSHFTVTANSPRFATACPIGAFTWLGQPFSYATGFAAQLTVTAVNRAGTPTQNYAGTWFRLSNATLARRSYRADGATVDESGLPAATLDPTITSNGDGSASLSFSAGSGITLCRGTPRAPFDAEIELSIDILDADATAYPTNPFRVGGTTAGAGIAFDTAKRFQFGRLRLDNGYGSELVTLPMRLRVQRFDGNAFDDNDSDSCSRVSASALVPTPSPATLSAPPSLENVPLLGGDAGLALGAPGAPGEIALRINLGATGANLPWLRSDWPDDGNLDGVLDDDPQARATFGIWEGRDALIFVRELY